jgi:hypothetical protein
MKFLDEYSNDIKKTILITNNHLIHLGGSEIVTLNLAKEFIAQSFDVTIGTFHYGNPMKALFEKHSIHVCLLSNDFLKEKKFDIIWGQHFPTLYNVFFKHNCLADHVIYNSMSPYEPLEAPPVFANMLSLCVANSEETKKKLIEDGVDEKNILIMPNPVEKEFLGQFNKNKPYQLKKICVVSNHIPQEIYEVRNLLTQNHITVDIFGVNDKPVYVTPNLLINYDGIITIGKTIQYGLIMGIPVYCYDRFGGPGWINKDNLINALRYNFSGRCSNRKLSSQEIYSEIVNGYQSAFGDRDFLYKFSLERFIMRDYINVIINIINSKNKLDIREIIKRYQS